MRKCGSRTTMGHGDVAICGEQYYGGIYQCLWCRVKDLESEVGRLRQAAQPEEATIKAENLLLTDVLNKARETLLVSIKGTPEDLQRSLGAMNLACKAHWDWQTERMRSSMNKEP